MYYTIKNTIFTKLFSLFTLGFFILSTIFIPQTSLAQFTQTLNFQGKLQDNGNIANGNYNIKFEICTDNACSNVIWTEFHDTANAGQVPVSSGIMNVTLGTDTTLTGVNLNQSLYLRISVDGTGPTPTYATPLGIIPLGMVPAAREADRLDGLDANRFAQVDSAGEVMSFDGTNLLSISGTDNIALGLNTDQGGLGSANTFIGAYTGQNNVGSGLLTGAKNTFIGAYAGQDNTTGESNTFIGHTAGLNFTTGAHNTFIGQSTASSWLTGNNNLIVGRLAGYQVTGGSSNTMFGYGTAWETTTALSGTTLIGYEAGRVTTENTSHFIGFQAGYNNTSGMLNTFNGYQAGYSNTVGNFNTFTGNGAGRNNNTGSGNSFFGAEAGFTNNSGTENTFIGNGAGYTNSAGTNNVFIGYRAGYDNDLGNNNVVIGHNAGIDLQSGLDNVFIGQAAGYSNNGIRNVFIGNLAGYFETGSNKLYIDNSNTGSPLIYGEFDNDLLRVNGSLEVTRDVNQGINTFSVTGFVQNSTLFTGARDIKVRGRYAYVVGLNNSSFSIIDVSDKSAPVVVGSLTDPVDLNWASGLEVVGDYAYVIGYLARKVAVVDISDPSTPVVVGATPDSNPELAAASNLAISGNYLFVSGYNANGTFTVVDVAEPTNPKIVGSITGQANLRYAHGMAVDGDYAYLATLDTNNLITVDVSDPTNPTIVNEKLDGGNFWDIYISGGYLYGVSTLSGSRLLVYDLSDPLAPAQVSSTVIISNPRKVKVQGKYAYITGETSNSIAVYDVSDPSAPVLVRSYTNSLELGGAWGLAVDGGYVYVGGGSASVYRFNILNLTTTDLPSAEIGHAKIGNLKVSNQILADDINITSGLAVGGRAYIDGQTSIFAKATLYSGLGVGSSTADFMIDDSSNGSGSGTLYIGNETIDTSVSDQRLKTNITNTTASALDFIDLLQVKSFDWLPDNPRSEQGQVTFGLIAQEVEAVAPQFIKKTDNPEDYISVRFQDMVPALVKAIQELRAQVSNTDSGLIRGIYEGMFDFVRGIFTPKLVTSELCVGSVCVTEAEFVEVFGSGYKLEPEITPVSENLTEPEPDIEPAEEAQSETVIESETESETESVTEPSSETEPEAVTETESEEDEHVEAEEGEDSEALDEESSELIQS